MNDPDGISEASDTVPAGDTAAYYNHQPLVSPEQDWPTDPQDACRVALEMAEKEAECGNAEVSGMFARYAAFKMEEMGETVAPRPGTGTLSDQRAGQWRIAWKIASQNFPLSEFRRGLQGARETGDTKKAAEYRRALAKVNRRVACLRSHLTAPTPASKGRSREARSGSHRTVRSSAKSGDSGSDPDESDIDPEQVCAAVDCDKPISARATFCSDACRIRDSRSRAELIAAADAEAADVLSDEWRADAERADLVSLMERNHGPGVLLTEGQEVAMHRRHAHAGARR